MEYIGNMARKKTEEFDELHIGKKIFIKNKKVATIKKGEIKIIFPSKVRPFSNSGGYIPTSEDYNNHKVYVIVLENQT